VRAVLAGRAIKRPGAVRLSVTASRVFEKTNSGPDNRAEYTAGKMPAKGCSAPRNLIEVGNASQQFSLRAGKHPILEEVRWQLK
jgi:hypothetical protein